MLDIAYVNNVGVIAKNPKMTAINSAIEVDLTGQVCSDSIGTRMYSGSYNRNRNGVRFQAFIKWKTNFKWNALLFRIRRTSWFHSWSCWGFWWQRQTNYRSSSRHQTRWIENYSNSQIRYVIDMETALKNGAVNATIDILLWSIRVFSAYALWCTVSYFCILSIKCDFINFLCGSWLHPGGGIVTTRAHVHYVVTEYGIAYLFGKTLRQRAHALINIAHPDHRESLEKAAFERLKCMPSA